MEYSLSAPALHAARTILRHFHVREKAASDIAFSETNLAKLIDRYTFSWRMKRAITELCTNVSWLDDTHNDVEHHLDLLIESVQNLEMLDRKLPRYEDEMAQEENFRDWNREKNGKEAKRRARIHQVSAVSVYAVRMIEEHFEFSEREDGQMPLNEANLAGIIDVCTQMFRVQDALHRMCAMVRSLSRQELASNMNMVRVVLRALDLARMRMPGYEAPRQLRVIKQAVPQPVIELSHEQKRNRQQVSLALSRTRSPEEARRVMDAAKSDRLI